MSNDVSSFFEERIEALQGLAGKPLERAYSRAFQDFEGHIWAWTRTACKNHGDREMMYSDDVFNHISIAMLDAIRKLIANPGATTVMNYYSYFSTISKHAAFAFFHSSERTGFSHKTGADRRVSKINKTRREMTIELGRQPSDQEVVNEVNRVALATRKDAKKQGALVTLEDVKTATVSSLDGMMEEFGDSIWDATYDENATLNRVEAPSLIDAIIAGCYAVSNDLGMVADLWVGDAVGEPPVIRNAREITEEMSLTLGEVTSLLVGCREVAQTVCKDRFGIDSPFS